MWPFPVFANAALALLVERFMGYPDALQTRIGHPVEWMGALIGRLDEALNRPEAPEPENRLRGAAALAIVIAAAFVPTWLIAEILSRWDKGWIIEALLATSLLAHKSLRDHVRAVHKSLGRSLAEGRRAVARIVGRDPERLDEDGVSRAALESLAENTSDGVVAPVLWYALLGLPGLAVYKAINTADSMIGHLNERHRSFGWAAAKLDDLVNLPASRLTGLLFAATDRRRFSAIVAIMRRDAPKHQSPNAGWPEAALAATLELRLGGPRAYDGGTVDLAFMGEGRSTVARDDIRCGLKVYGRAMTWLLVGLTVLALIF